ncbi:hypothetical protein SCHPADRAFT_843164, partial [Schizopora paradoxa]
MSSKSVLGSVFLGDAQRQLGLSPPTSPSTSPPSNAPSFSSKMMMDAVNNGALDHGTESAPLLPIDPALSLELRVRWLEVLLLGVKHEHGASGSKPAKTTLVRGAEELHGKLDEAVQANDGLRKFMDRYDRHADLLTPSFALSGIASPSIHSSLSEEELNALLAEMEPELKAADRDLRDIDVLEKRGVLGAGKLADYKELIPRLEALRSAQKEDLRQATDLEKRIADVLRRYTTRVDALSELFVEWNDVLSSAEDKVSRLERERADMKRLGYE